jgi:hypothetical protein
MEQGCTKKGNIVALRSADSPRSEPFSMELAKTEPRLLVRRSVGRWQCVSTISMRSAFSLSADL